MQFHYAPDTIAGMLQSLHHTAQSNPVAAYAAITIILLIAARHIAR